MPRLRFFFFNLCSPAYYDLLVLRRIDSKTYCPDWMIVLSGKDTVSLAFLQ